MTDAAPRIRVRPQGITSPPPSAVVPIEQRHPGLTRLMDAIAKQMGAGIVSRASAIPGFTQVETGIFTLDMALLGGIPEGLTTMLFGWESCGKTTLAKRIAGRVQRKYPDGAVAFVDLEQTFDNTWAAKHNVDIDRLYLVRPETGEQAVDIIAGFLQQVETKLIIIDSLPALVPMAEANASAEDALVAIRARLVARLCSQIQVHTMRAKLRGHFPTVIMINQWRTAIGTMKKDPRVLPCGNQPKYLATTMLEIKNREMLAKNAVDVEVASHNEHAFNVKKSRIGNSIRQEEYRMVRDPRHPLGEGAMDDAPKVVAYARRFGLVTGGGSSWRIDGVDTRFGKLAEIDEFLNNDQEEMLDLQRRVIMVQRQDMGLPQLPPDRYLLGHVE